MSASQEITLGAIASLTDQPYWRIEYIIKTRRIAACATASRVRCFDVDALERIQAAIAEMDARRSKPTTAEGAN